MYTDSKPGASACGLCIGIAVSTYHAKITTALRDAAVKQFTDAQGAEGDLRVVCVPGTFELTAVCRALVDGGGFDAIVALGCVISGETTHDTYIATAVAHGLTELTLATGVPVTFGVLTCQTIDQARARAGGPRGNKGAEAMAAAIETATIIKSLAGQKERR